MLNAVLYFQTSPQFFDAVSAYGQNLRRPTHMKGKPAVVPGEDVLNILKLYKTCFVNTEKSSSFQLTLIFGHGGGVGIRFLCERMDDAAAPCAVCFNVCNVINVNQRRKPIAMYRNTAYAMGGFDFSSVCRCSSRSWRMRLGLKGFRM